MRKGRRERIEKGSRDGIEKETKRRFEENVGLRDPPDVAIVSSSPHGMASWSSSKLIARNALLKICHGVKKNAKKKW